YWQSVQRFLLRQPRGLNQWCYFRVCTISAMQKESAALSRAPRVRPSRAVKRSRNAHLKLTPNFSDAGLNKTFRANSRPILTVLVLQSSRAGTQNMMEVTDTNIWPHKRKTTGTYC